MNIVDRQEIDAACVGAEDRELIDVAHVRALRDPWIGMMRVRTTGVEDDAPVAEAPGLALHAR